MKKIIFSILLIGITISLSAQAAQPWRDVLVDYTANIATSTFSLNTDTVAASATIYLSLETIYGQKTLSVSPYALNISGTTGVLFTLQGYIGNTWTDLTVNNCTDLTAGGDTITLTTATAGLWTLTTNLNSYRIRCTANGTTQSSIVAATYMVKP